MSLIIMVVEWNINFGTYNCDDGHNHDDQGNHNDDLGHDSVNEKDLEVNEVLTSRF